MRALLFATAAVTILVAAIPASAQNNGNDRGGSDYGPMGQCQDARVCGHGRSAQANARVNPGEHRKLLMSDGKCWQDNHGTDYSWGKC